MGGCGGGRGTLGVQKGHTPAVCPLYFSVVLWSFLNLAGVGDGVTFGLGFVVAVVLLELVGFIWQLPG